MAVIAMSYITLEFSTVPLRLLSFPQERIREEIRKGNIDKIASISTNHISLDLLNEESKKKYKFKEDRVFIPIADLELNFLNSKKFPYKLKDTKTNALLLEGNFDFSEAISKNKELETMIEENDLKKKMKECNSIYSRIADNGITFTDAKKELDIICPIYGMQAIDPIENETRYKLCYDNFEGCYYLTRKLKK